MFEWGAYLSAFLIFAPNFPLFELLMALVFQQNLAPFKHFAPVQDRGQNANIGRKDCEIASFHKLFVGSARGLIYLCRFGPSPVP